MEPSRDAVDTGHAPRALLADLIIPGLALALTGYYLVSTADLGWEAKATGTLVGSVLILLCLVFLARTAMAALKRPAELNLGGLLANDEINRRRLALVVLAALFIAVIPWLGTTLGLLLLLMASLRVAGVTRATELILIPLATAATVYVLLIWLLNTRLPRGLPETLLATWLPGGG